MEYEGTITAVEPMQEGISKVTGKPWKKQGFVISNTAESLSSSLYFAVFNDNIAKMTGEGMKEGASGHVYVDITARYYNGRWFNDVRGWKWNSSISWEQTAAQVQPQVQPQPQRVEAGDYLKKQPAGTAPKAPAAQPGALFPNSVNNDDLPF